ncbi:DUF3553 domain-containing protein [Geomesophilobacter sediminis]|uniref:DUF3553 domain-containing protein n=1 Tax=Geomesophilobacter sediminis TaxID=2798584 RepID=A0A8J7M268_9BACT|nr:DUF3553 domain-containing protein [Geomesophilobacter sediminis]MBJ6727213.1 DUF3553 domain-containing protein [Geomesophilobacter sediminis]
MNIKRGTVVSHAAAVEWGIGKVVEVTYTSATIEFSDGLVRKIAAAHYPSLVPADPAFFVPIPAAIPAVKARATSSKAKVAKVKKTAL